MDAAFDTTKMITSKQYMECSDSIESWVEIWDYVGDVLFKGFVGGRGFAKSLFVFIGEGVVGKSMKPGYETSQR